ncbi:hypothetical protein H4Q26_008671 [Puccinia striiformis f. sp. tritici PST-130]|nr:hypothetical protein H4Q26_008671 [Puccinia striiformis f. sp. tritici PST-130]
MDQKSDVMDLAVPNKIWHPSGAFLLLVNECKALAMLKKTKTATRNSQHTLDEPKSSIRRFSSDSDDLADTQHATLVTH